MGDIRNICNSCMQGPVRCQYLSPSSWEYNRQFVLVFVCHISCLFHKCRHLFPGDTTYNFKLKAWIPHPQTQTLKQLLKLFNRIDGGISMRKIYLENFVASLFITEQKENQGHFWMLGSPQWPFNGKDNILMDERGSLSCNEMVCLHLSPLSSYHSPSQTRRTGLAWKINFWWCTMTRLQTFRKMSSGKSLS